MVPDQVRGHHPQQGAPGEDALNAEASPTRRREPVGLSALTRFIRSVFSPARCTVLLSKQCLGDGEGRAVRLLPLDLGADLAVRCFRT